MKLRRQNVHQEHSHEKIERVQRPAKKTGADRVPLLGIQ